MPYRKRNAGFTVVELLVSIAVVAVLCALLLPATMYARESARLASCRNNLRQIGVAVMSFESTNRHIPGNGWGFLWIGDPDRGVGKDQPGGWAYQLLPFLGYEGMSSIGRGVKGVEKDLALSVLSKSSLEVFQCPSRPAPAVSACNPVLKFANSQVSGDVAKTDYAICEGDFITDTSGGPNSLEEGDDPGFEWTDTSKATGISYLRSEVRLADVRDGTSQTYLVGEKYVSQGGYLGEGDLGNDQPLWSGVDLDVARWTRAPPLPDGMSSQYRRFGSAHASGAAFVFCDGSVRMISFTVDANVHRSLGNRHDGLPIGNK